MFNHDPRWPHTYWVLPLSYAGKLLSIGKPLSGGS